MKIYIRKNFEGEFVTASAASASLGFREMGFEVIPYQAFSELKDARIEDIVVGYVGEVRAALKAFGVETPELDYPVELSDYLGRKIWASTINQVANLPESWPVFVKPERDKLFTGRVINGTKDLIGCGIQGENAKVWCSEVIPFVAEFRCFVRYGEIIDVRHYTGDWRVQFDAATVEQAVNAYTSAPNGDALDFGVTETGKTLVVEVNDGYSLGTYGLFNNDYAKLLSARWSELTQTPDSCKF